MDTSRIELVREQLRDFRLPLDTSPRIYTARENNIAPIQWNMVLLERLVLGAKRRRGRNNSNFISHDFAIFFGYFTLFTIRMSMIPVPSTIGGRTVVPVHVPIGTQIQVCTVPAYVGGVTTKGCKGWACTTAGKGWNIGNGVNNGNPARVTEENILVKWKHIF